MKIIKSKLKTDKEGFNNLSNRQEIKNALKSVDCSIVDIDMTYWQNCGDTIVLLVKDMLQALQVGKFAKNQLADELHYQKTEAGNYIVRLWWD